MVSPVSAAQKAASLAARYVRREEVTYTRGTTTLEISVAMRGSTKWDTEQIDNGVHGTERSVDWILSLTELTLSDGTVLEPQRGDEITDVLGTVYRVMPFGMDQQLWKWHDRDSRSAYRVFTKERR